MARNEYEDRIRAALQHACQAIGLWDYHPPDDSPMASDGQIWELLKKLNKASKANFDVVREILSPPKWDRSQIAFAKPDIYNLNPKGPSVVIECKWIESKKRIDPWFDPASIRDNQRKWLDAWAFQAEGPAYIGIGSFEPKRLWLIDWYRWVEMERMLGEKALDFRIVFQDLQWCGKEFELEPPAAGEKVWKFKPEHSIWAYAPAVPIVIDWDKAYSFRFTPKKGEPSDRLETEASGS